MSSSAVHAEVLKKGENISLVTVKRTLSEMAAQDLLVISGLGRTTSYNLTTRGKIFADIDAKAYCAVEPDKRYGMNSFASNFLAELPEDLFTNEELIKLNSATLEYERRITDLPSTIQKKELERLIIELSWKSSKIEGNTYTLLDTEKLILEHKVAPGHDKKEAAMILNHKDAFTFIHNNKAVFKTLSLANLEKLHAILTKDLNIGLGLRKKPVGVIGSKYRPLDNIYQINEAIVALVRAVSRMKTPYAKALIALLGISYIQPFEDGNKRTSRLMTNALLLAHGCAPLSYRSVDENEYREAMLVFYELNSIVPMKKIFIDQYDFAVKNYAVK
ncbi:MAG: Fic family protein [bacterium]|nr:Fic family protein [bacterium]